MNLPEDRKLVPSLSDVGHSADAIRYNHEHFPRPRRIPRLESLLCISRFSRLSFSDVTSHTTQKFILLVAIAVIIFLPLASSSTQTQAMVPSTDATYAVYTSNAPVTSSTFNDLPSSETRVETPRMAGVRKPKRKRKNKAKCPKKYRKSYCMNKGKCRWVEDLGKPTCRCKKGWVGERCDETYIDFTTSDSEQNSILLTIIVVSVFALIGVTTLLCICWRRFKNIRKELKTEENVKETKIMLEDITELSTR